MRVATNDTPGSSHNEVMHFSRFLLPTVGLLAVFAAQAAHKVVSPSTTGSNDNADISATITLAEDEVAQKLGADPGKGVALVEVRFTPKTDKPVRISPDDFVLLSHDDGQRSKPFDPNQLAGKGGLVLAQGPGTGGQLSRTPGAPIGTGTNGRPRNMPGGGNGIGNSGGSSGGLKTEANDKDQGNNSLLTALKAKQFPDTTSADEVSGYLYFPLDGKHKLKNLAILYRGQAGRIDMEFEH